QVVLGLDNAFDVIREKTRNAVEQSAPMTLWHYIQCILLNVRSIGGSYGKNMEGFGSDEALLFLNAVRNISGSQKEGLEQIAERLLTHDFSDSLFFSLVELWCMAGKYKYFDLGHIRQRRDFSRILESALLKAWEISKKRLTHPVSRNDRLPYRLDHLISPVPLTVDLLSHNKVENYFFLESQVEIPGIRRLFGSVGPLPTGTAFVVSNEGHIVTCSHCVEGTDLEKWGAEVRVLHVREKKEEPDLALLQIPILSGREPISLPNVAASVPSLGFSIGYPRFFQDNTDPVILVSMGRISLDGSGGYLVDSESRGGSSGSPVVDVDGHLLGMVYGSELLKVDNDRSFAERVGIVSGREIQRLLRKFGLIENED
ncbi:MAG: serine protease, partial [Deltaproteobacteria bacterium]|nr:serine protease [Deltaproteobacteria bacterium]